MFLKKLYLHSKGMFLSFAVFLSAFFFLNYKWGVVATPVLQFGMFSGAHHISDTQTVYIVMLQDKPVLPGVLSTGSRDKVQGYIERYETHRQANEGVFKIFSKYWRAAGLSSLATPGKFNPVVTDAVFSGWFKSKIGEILALPADSLQVYRQHYAWKNGQFNPLDSVTKLPFIDAE